ncbi:MAG TPA: hypothetical protein VEB86_20120, partial [Chryseosolibacter sp.]|nr:hypothetical protein [Chryseosolibacter sp.]
FAKRNDGNPNTHAFVASPEITTAFAIAGDLTFNPVKDTLVNDEGKSVKLDEPAGVEFPPRGFEVKDAGYIAPAADGSKVQVKIDPKSNRLQALEPFKAWDGKNLIGMKLLLKAKGKCTTDHISMAGPWLRFRGHLDNISNNTLTGAVNAFNDKTDSVKNQLNGEYGAVPATQRAYKAAGVPTIVVGDHNYGEGSSREHAAMQPRHLGIRVILVKSFARIHETNLKKQGMLAVTFSEEADYDKIQEDDSIDIIDLTEFSPDRQLTVVLNHKDGSKDTIKVNHTYNAGQIEWFKAGSALNLMARQIAAASTFQQPVSRPIVTKVSGKKVVRTVKATKKLEKKRSAKNTRKELVAKKAAAKKPAKKVATKAKKSAVKPKNGKAKNGIAKKMVRKVVKAVARVLSKKKTVKKKK